MELLDDRGPRFWRLAARIGLTAYWQARQAWPDLCADEMTKAQRQAAATTD